MKKIFGKYCLHCKYWKCERNWIKWIFIIIGILIIISLVIILLIVLPSTLITTLHIPFGCLNTDFTNTGQIGDTIGGITAPFIGLISIWLLYITFREQRKFNKEQINFQKQHGDNTIMINLQSQIQEQINSLRTNINDNKIQISGLFGLEQLNHAFYDTKIDFVDFQALCNHLKTIGDSIELFLKTNYNSSLSFENKELHHKYATSYIDFICKFYQWFINTAEENKIDHIEVVVNDKQIKMEEEDESAVGILSKSIKAEKAKLEGIQKKYLPIQK